MNKYFRKIFTSTIIGLTLSACCIVSATAQDAVLVSGSEGRIKVQVTDIVQEYDEQIEGQDLIIHIQDVNAKILKGEQKGMSVSFKNDYVSMKVGDKVFLDTTTLEDGQMLYAVSDFERRPVLIVFMIVFFALVIGFGRMQGFRSLVSLGVSIIAIFFVLIPLLIKGYNPVLVATAISAVILFIAIFFTHGFNRKSTIAFSGTVLAVIVTGLLAYVAVIFGHITGLSAQESVYLNYNTQGNLDFAGLFLASIMIGMLGVLDDISITQVAVVRELYGVAPHMTKKQLFESAIRVGKEHVGALVNTLVLAYIGVALPTVMYFSMSTMGTGELMNREVFASEILRTILGSIGLILTVPITTWLAVIFLKDFKGKKMTVEEMEHGHSHAGHGHHH